MRRRGAHGADAQHHDRGVVEGHAVPLLVVTRVLLYGGLDDEARGGVGARARAHERRHVSVEQLPPHPVRADEQVGPSWGDRHDGKGGYRTDSGSLAVEVADDARAGEAARPGAQRTARSTVCVLRRRELHAALLEPPLLVRTRGEHVVLSEAGGRLLAACEEDSARDADMTRDHLRPRAVDGAHRQHAARQLRARSGLTLRNLDHELSCTCEGRTAWVVARRVDEVRERVDSAPLNERGAPHADPHHCEAHHLAANDLLERCQPVLAPPGKWVLLGAGRTHGVGGGGAGERWPPKRPLEVLLQPGTLPGGDKLRLGCQHDSGFVPCPTGIKREIDEK